MVDIAKNIQIIEIAVNRLLKLISRARHYFFRQLEQNPFQRIPCIPELMIVLFALVTLFVSGLSSFPRTIEAPTEIAVISPPEDAAIQGDPQVTIQDLPHVKPMRLFAVSSEYDHTIFNIARELDVDPALVKAIVQSESAFDKFAVSTQGARGLMQLMPATAERFSVQDPFDAEQNIRGGVRFLKHLLVTFDNDERLAVAAYNAGPGRVLYYGSVPPFIETYTYVSKVLGLQKLYSDFKDESGNSFAMLEAAISI